MNIAIWNTQGPTSLEKTWTKLSQVQMLTAYLFLLHGEDEAKLVATQLVDRFGSLSRAINAPTARILEVERATARTAHYLHLLQDFLSWSTAARVVLEKPILTSWSLLIDYCRVEMACRDVEQFRVLYLDKRNRLIADECQAMGTVDHCPVYPREIIRRSLELSATAIVLIHNHPSGDPQPSSQDVKMTRELADAAKPLGITVHDHIIVAATGHTSLRSCRLI